MTTDITLESIRGNAVASSDGIVIGRVQKLTTGRHPIPERHLEETDIAFELQRLDSALAEAMKELEEEREHLLSMKTQEPMMILQAHGMMLQDPELIDRSRQLIEEKKINAEWALRQQLDTIEAVFDTIEDPYLRDKKSDVEQAGVRILRHLTGQSLKFELLGDSEPQILISKEFTPRDIIMLWRMGIAGIIAEQGGLNAHSIIVARGIGLPALVGSDDVMNKANDGDTIILDAEQGRWIINPSEDDQQEYRKFISALEIIRDDLGIFASKPSLSSKNEPLPIMANIEFGEELNQALQVGAEGIGLFRTEFAFLQHKEMPTVSDLYRQYAHVVKGMNGMPVTFRLLDIGGDKPTLYRQLAGYKYKGENPALGLRGVRLLLHFPEMLKLQLTALIKAAEEGPINILVPMISTIEEMERVRELLEQCKIDLGVTDNLNLGSMVEVPAAVMIAKDLANVSDFFSIGTNDLIQYTLAADRGDEDVSKFYTSMHPAIRQLIQSTVDAGKSANIPVSICGELAADPEWTQTFLNMNMNSLSMSLHSILNIRKHLSRLSRQTTH